MFRIGAKIGKNRMQINCENYDFCRSQRKTVKEGKEKSLIRIFGSQNSFTVKK
jgi:hypothetical protein